MIKKRYDKHKKSAGSMLDGQSREVKRMAMGEERVTTCIRPQGDRKNALASFDDIYYTVRPKRISS
jgi:hypothetical protein